MGTRAGSLSQSRATAQKGSARISSCSHSVLSFFISALFFEFDQPGNAIVQNRGAQGIENELAVLFGHDEVRLFEQIEMMRDARFADGKTVRDLARRHLLLPQQLENATTGGIVDSFKEHVHRFDI